jgi:transcriptional regulator with XRE-family HTH domain
MNGPTVRRRRLGAELRALRERRDIKLVEAADLLGLSPSVVSRIETGQGPCRPIYLNAMLDLYQVTGNRGPLHELARGGSKQGWWASYDSLLPSGVGMYVGLESDATALRNFEPVVVHGLLQTPEYARTVLRQTHPRRSPEDISRLVQLRMDRQRRLADRDPFEVWLIHDEAVLKRIVGGPEIMSGQLAHLLDAMEVPGVTLQILPFEAGAHAGMRGGFTVLAFDNGNPAVYVEGPAGVACLERPDELDHFSRAFDYLTAAALPPQQTRDRIVSALHHVHRPRPAGNTTVYTTALAL